MVSNGLQWPQSPVKWPSMIIINGLRWQWPPRVNTCLDHTKSSKTLRWSQTDHPWPSIATPGPRSSTALNDNHQWPQHTVYGLTLPPMIINVFVNESFNQSSKQPNNQSLNQINQSFNQASINQ